MSTPTTDELERWVDGRVRTERQRLAHTVIATEAFRAYPDDGFVTRIDAGTELPADHPFVVADQDKFRALRAEEVTVRLKGAAAGWRLEAGL